MCGRVVTLTGRLSSRFFFRFAGQRGRSEGPVRRFARRKCSTPTLSSSSPPWCSSTRWMAVPSPTASAKRAATRWPWPAILPLGGPACPPPLPAAPRLLRTAVRDAQDRLPIATYSSRRLRAGHLSPSRVGNGALPLLAAHPPTPAQWRGAGIPARRHCCWPAMTAQSGGGPTTGLATLTCLAVVRTRLGLVGTALERVLSSCWHGGTSAWCSSWPPGAIEHGFMQARTVQALVAGCVSLVLYSCLLNHIGAIRPVIFSAVYKHLHEYTHMICVQEYHLWFRFFNLTANE